MTKFDASLWIPVVSGLAGIVIGAVLSPYLSGRYKRKQKILRVDIFDQNPITLISHRSDIKILWDGDEFESIVQVGFQISNLSGNTLRNFTIEIEAGDYPSVNEDVFDVYFESNESVRFEEIDGDRIRQDGNSEAGFYRFDIFPPNSVLRGSIITNGSNKIRFLSKDDVELDCKKGSVVSLSKISREVFIESARSLPIMGVVIDIVSGRGSKNA